jgi:hypothetical protein
VAKFKITQTEFYHTWYAKTYEIEVPDEDLPKKLEDQEEFAHEAFLEAMEYNEVDSELIEQDFMDIHDVEINKIVS